jgi:hypothetical protein
MWSPKKYDHNKEVEKKQLYPQFITQPHSLSFTNSPMPVPLYTITPLLGKLFSMQPPH